MTKRQPPSRLQPSILDRPKKLLTWVLVEGTYEWRTEMLRIGVHRHIHHDPDVWILTCYEVGIREHELKEKDLEKAKGEALEFVRAWLARVLRSLT